MSSTDPPPKLNRDEVLANMKNLLGHDLQRQERLGDSQITLLAITPQKIRPIATFLSESNYYLHTIFGRHVDQHFEISYLILSQVRLLNTGFLLQITQPGKEFPTIADVFPNAEHWQENLNHRLGVQFHIEILQVKDNSEFCIPYKINIPKIKDQYQLIGIFHPIHSERSYVNMHIDYGDNISKIELTDGWLYQNLCSRLERAEPIKEIPLLLENISPSCSVSLKLGYLHALEQILEKSIPLKAKFIRTLLAEVERISSHFLWFSNLALLIGLKELSYQFSKQSTALQSLFQQQFEGKLLVQLFELGTATDFSPDTAKLLYPFFKSKKVKNKASLHRFLTKPYVQNRLQGRGQLTSEEALKMGVTGPTLRGSGIPLDIRASHPYL
ncbi:MAG: hypothetical protein KAR20_21760, partial [Candidatus Heimdallarchaeota archaeon]|nr:hypothetical protein [Candidatus Heimdallarchaeota archaeon]